MKKSVEMAEKEGLTKSEKVLQVEEYRDAPKVREARGTTGAIEEAAHITPASILEKNFPNYNRRYDLTTLLPPEVHSELDKTWKIWVNALKKENKRQATVKEFRDKVFEAIENTPTLTPNNKGDLQRIVYETLHIDLGAQAKDLLTIW